MKYELITQEFQPEICEFELVSQKRVNICGAEFDESFIATTFDSSSTTFIALAKDSGAVYMYDLMANPFESEDNPSLFAFTQKLIGPDTDTGFNFGASIWKFI